MEHLGVKVMKQFKGHGIFHGRVTDFDRESGFRVIYEDGDTEDLKREALLTLLEKTAKLQKEIDRKAKPKAAAAEEVDWSHAIPPFNPSAAGGSRSVGEFVKRARDAARRKRKHTDLKLKAVARAKLRGPPPPKRQLVVELVGEKLPLMRPPEWALGLDREGRCVRCDAAENWGPTPLVSDDLTLYQLTLTWGSPTAVKVGWTYPPANPGDTSSWVGLFPAHAVTWLDTYGEVSSGKARLAFKTLTQNQRRGEISFSRLPAAIPDGEYVFTLQRDYGVKCVCVSDRFQVQGGKVVGLLDGTALATEANERFDHKERQKAKSLGLLVQRSRQREPAAEEEEEWGASRACFPVSSIEVTLGRDYESALLKAVYRIVDRESYLDWGLSSDYESVHGAVEIGGKHRVRNRHVEDRLQPAGEDSAELGESGAAERQGKRVLGLGGGALGSEGYGEATMGSVHRIGLALQHLRELVLRELKPDGWGVLWDLGPWSSFLDIGSGYGKVVLHLRLLAGMHTSVGVECVHSRHTIGVRAKHLCETEEEACKGSDSCKGPGREPRASPTSVTEEQSSSSSSSSPAEPSTTPAAEGPVPRIAGRAFDGAELRYGDVTTEPRLCFTHIYIFDWVFAKPTLAKVAKVLQASPFYVLVSFRKPAEWWSYGLVKVQPVAKLSGFRTTGGEGMTAWIYINLEKVPGAV